MKHSTMIRNTLRLNRSSGSWLLRHLSMCIEWRPKFMKAYASFVMYLLKSRPLLIIRNSRKSTIHSSLGLKPSKT